jgi:hypothetical protein
MKKILKLNRRQLKRIISEEYVNIDRAGGAREMWNVEFTEDNSSIKSGTREDDIKSRLKPYVNPNIEPDKLDGMLSYLAGHPAISRLLDILENTLDDYGYGPNTILRDPSEFNPENPLVNKELDLSATLDWPHITKSFGGGEGRGEFQIKTLYAFDSEKPEPDVVLNNNSGYHIKASLKKGASFGPSPAGQATKIGKDLFAYLTDLFEKKGLDSPGKYVGKKDIDVLINAGLSEDEKRKIIELQNQVKRATVTDREAKGLIVLTPEGSSFFEADGNLDDIKLTAVRQTGMSDLYVGGRSSLVEFKNNIRKLVHETLTRSDETRIQSLARQVAKEEMRKAFGGGTFKQAIETEIIKALGKRATKQEIAEITKAVLVKLYRELSYSYRPVIDRIKV